MTENEMIADGLIQSALRKRREETAEVNETNATVSARRGNSVEIYFKATAAGEKVKAMYFQLITGKATDINRSKKCGR